MLSLMKVMLSSTTGRFAQRMLSGKVDWCRLKPDCAFDTVDTGGVSMSARLYDACFDKSGLKFDIVIWKIWWCF